MSGAEALHAHLASGIATVARCWQVTRRDGRVLGFTDHDRPLEFAGLTFRAETGLSAKALEQSTGLAVDNTEAIGALSDAGLSAADIVAGRYDGAEVVAWLVNWADVTARKILFRGHIGEITRVEGAFHAELRGLSETLNRPVGRVYQRPCTAVLGDAACGFDTAAAGFSARLTVQEVPRPGAFVVADPGFAPGWFQRGSLTVFSGAAAGLMGAIKHDHRLQSGLREAELWAPLRADVAVGDEVDLVAGCDKRFATCREKFDNALNFQGFPDLPEEDWMSVSPAKARTRDGGSRR